MRAKSLQLCPVTLWTVARTQDTTSKELNMGCYHDAKTASTEILNSGRDHASEIQEDEDKVLSPEVY